MKLKKAKEDAIVFTLLLAVCVYFLTYGIDQQIPESPAAKGQMFTPRTFPQLCISVIAICCVIGVLKSVRKYFALKSSGDSGEKVIYWRELSSKEKIGRLMPLISFGLCVLYAILFSNFGFIAATIIIPPILLLCMGCRKWQNYLWVYGFCAIMYVIFVFVLKVQIL